MADDPEPTAHVDRHVGGRIRLRRKLLGRSQAWLASAVGVSFQQVQKYERGANRISAGRLYAVAMALETSAPFFFEGLEPSGASGEDRGRERIEHALAFLTSPDGLAWAEAITAIRSPRLRGKVLALTRALADAAVQAT